MRIHYEDIIFFSKRWTMDLDIYGSKKNAPNKSRIESDSNCPFSSSRRPEPANKNPIQMNIVLRLE
jgi:hypothetical protein